MVLIDYQKEIENYQRKKVRSIFFLSLISLLVVAIIAVGIIFSPPQFIGILIGLVVLFIVYSIGTLMFLIGPFKEIVVKLKIFQNISASSIFEEELVLTGINDETSHSYQGLVSLQIKFFYFDEEQKNERTLYVLLPNDSKLEIGKRYKVCSSNNLILSYKEIL